MYLCEVSIHSGACCGTIVDFPGLARLAVRLSHSRFLGRVTGLGSCSLTVRIVTLLALLWIAVVAAFSSISMREGVSLVSGLGFQAVESFTKALPFLCLVTCGFGLGIS